METVIAGVAQRCGDGDAAHDDCGFQRQKQVEREQSDGAGVGWL